jgi:hypothetical protein
MVGWNVAPGQGDQISFVKKTPKMLPNPCFEKNDKQLVGTAEKSSPKKIGQLVQNTTQSKCTVTQ